MTSRQDILNYLQPLVDKYYIQMTIEDIVRAGHGGKMLASVSRPLIKNDEKKGFYRDGQFYKKRSIGWILKIGDEFFKLEEREQKAVLVHEFGHILQYEYMNDKELSSYRSNTDTDRYISITSRNGNMLEVMAEAFCISILGYSLYSKIHAKDNCLIDEVNNLTFSYSPW